MRYSATLDDVEHEVDIEELAANSYRVRVGPHEVEVESRKIGPASFSVLVGDRSFDLEVSRDGEQVLVVSRGGLWRITLEDRTRRATAARARPQASGRAELKALMPGRVVQVLVAPGDEVDGEQGVLIVEAMKMENELKTPKAGKILEVNVTVGRTVEKGDILIVVE